MGETYIYHSAKGTRWKKHKYIRVTEDGRYIYANMKDSRLLGQSTKSGVKEYSLDGLKNALDVTDQKKMTDLPTQRGFIGGIKKKVNTISKEVKRATTPKKFSINKWNIPLRNVKRATIESNMQTLSDILSKTSDRKLGESKALPKKKKQFLPKKRTIVEKSSRIRR